MKIFNAVLFGCFAVLNFGTYAQPAPKSTLCECERVEADKKRRQLYSNTQAQQIINEYCKLFVHPARIYPKPYACKDVGPIYSQLCEDEQKYVFYDEPFLDNLVKSSRLGDRFVLAHEIAHHLLGHTERAFRLGRQQSIPGEVAKDTRYKSRNKAKKTQMYGITMPQRHLHELEADALGLWMVVQKGATRADIKQIFDVMPRLLSVYKGIPDEETSTDSHPSLVIRKNLIERYWTKFERPTLAMQYQNVVDSIDFVPLQHEVKEFYAYQLLSADEERQAQLTRTERDIRDSLSRRYRFSVDVLGGGVYQRPVLRRDGEPVAATDSRGWVAGLRFGVGAWFKRHRAETDVKVASSSFTTQAAFADGLRTVEVFNSQYLYVQPRYVYSRIGRGNRYKYGTGVWQATAGLSVNVPLTFDYKNYALLVDPVPTQRTSVAPVIGVGYSHANWLTRSGHVRIGLMYQPQLLNLSVGSGEKISAWLHTLSLEASVRL